MFDVKITYNFLYILKNIIPEKNYQTLNKKFDLTYYAKSDF